MEASKIRNIAIIAHVSNRKILVQRPGLDPSQPRPKVFIEKTSDTATIAGRRDCAPKSTKVGRDCIVNTNPIMNAVVPTSGTDL